MFTAAEGSKISETDSDYQAGPEEIVEISKNPHSFAKKLHLANRHKQKLEITVKYMKLVSKYENYASSVIYAESHFTDLINKSSVYFDALYKELFPMSLHRLDPDFVQASFENSYLFEALEKGKMDVATKHLLNTLFHLDGITEHKDSYIVAFKFLFSQRDYLYYILTNIDMYKHETVSRDGDEYKDQNTLTLSIHFFARIKLDLVTLDDVKNLISNMKNKNIDKLNDFIPEHLRVFANSRSACKSWCVLS